MKTIILFVLFLSTAILKASTLNRSILVDLAQNTVSFQGFIISQNATPSQSDSNNLTDATVMSNYYFIERDGSYGGIGLKVGWYNDGEKNRLQASCIIRWFGCIYQLCNEPQRNYFSGFPYCKHLI